MLAGKQEFFKPKKSARVLTILGSIERSPSVSQSALAELAGISVAMINGYIRDMQECGLIKMTGSNHRRIRYHLTDQGRRMFSDLLRSYSTEVIQLYGIAKRGIEDKLRKFVEEGIRRIALFGAAETGEVVLAAAEGLPIEIVAVVDNDCSKQGGCLGSVRICHPDELAVMDLDAVVVSSFAHQEAIVSELAHLRERGTKIRTL